MVLREAYQSLNVHKSRTISMGFGVLWAIFMLVLLLGVGNGFHSGISKVFAKYGEKNMVIWAGSVAGKNCPIPTAITSNLSKRVSAIQHVSTVLEKYSGSVAYEDKIAKPYVFGLNSCHALVTDIAVIEGRFFTARDEVDANNRCIIGLRVKEKLFGATSAIGKYILLGNISLQVVGVVDALGISFCSESESLLLTSSFLQRAFPKDSRYVRTIHLTLKPAANEEVAESQIRSYFARYLNFDVKDKEGIHVLNIAAHANKIHRFFKNLSIFIWIIGICFLITGIVSVSNMMLVIVQERTQEIAIRRVLGSRSKEIMVMILYEVTIVTLIAGIIGFTAGFFLIQLLNIWVVPLFKSYYLLTLTCPPKFVFGGLGFLLLTSCLASIVPAIRAIKIKPVEALGGA